MVELKNGKLKIDSKRSALEILLDISIVAMLTVLFAFNEQTEGQHLHLHLVEGDIFFQQTEHFVGSMLPIYSFQRMETSHHTTFFPFKRNGA